MEHRPPPAISLRNPVCTLHLQYMPMWTSLVASAQRPPVTSGLYTENTGPVKPLVAVDEETEAL